MYGKIAASYLREVLAKNRYDFFENVTKTFYGRDSTSFDNLRMINNTSTLLENLGSWIATTTSFAGYGKTDISAFINE